MLFRMRYLQQISTKAHRQTVYIISMHLHQANNFNTTNIDKANSDYECNKKEFWAFVGRRTKDKKKGIVALRNSTSVSVTSTKGKLEVLKTHYRELGSCSVDSAFDDSKLERGCRFTG